MRVAKEVTKKEQKIEIKKPKERTGVSSDSQSAFMVALMLEGQTWQSNGVN
jgi:hypothetical protein